VTGNFIGIASICGPIFTNFILNDTPDFLVVFLVGGGLCIIKLIILIFFDENDAYKFENVDSLLGEDKNQDNRIEKDNEDEIPTTNNDEGEGITDN
jgi:hypothetical protein